MINGELIDDDHSRFCEEHGKHGILYVCPRYPVNIQQEVKMLGDLFIKQCLDGTIMIKDFINQGET